jgi:hypothetical protein
MMPVAVVGIACEFCGRVFPIQVVGLSVDEITSPVLRTIVDMFCKKHGKIHAAVMQREIEEALRNE